MVIMVVGNGCDYNPSVLEKTRELLKSKFDINDFVFNMHTDTNEVVTLLESSNNNCVVITDIQYFTANKQNELTAFVEKASDKKIVVLLVDRNSNKENSLTKLAKYKFEV